MSNKRILHKTKKFEVSVEATDEVSKDDKDFMLIQVEEHRKNKEHQVSVLKSKIESKARLLEETQQLIRTWTFSLTVADYELTTLNDILKQIEEVKVKN